MNEAKSAEPRRIAKRVAGAKPSVMASLVIRSRELRTAGKYVIDLAAGVPDYKPHEGLLQAAQRAIRHGQHSYGDARGLAELRQALASRFAEDSGAQFDADTEVTVTAGASAGLTSTLLALVNPGENVAMFEPFFEQFIEQIRLCGAKPKFIPLEAPRWTFDRSKLARVLGSAKTRVLIMNSPHNPTGRVFSRSELEEIARLCVANDVTVISDETYASFAFDAPHISLCSLPGMRERTVTLTSISKTLNVSGWRIGSVFAPADLTDALRKVNNLALGAPVPLQEACANALERYEDLLCVPSEDMQRQRDRLCTALVAAGFRPCVPEGTLSLLVNVRNLGLAGDRTACDWLLSNVGILAAPASAFFAGNRGNQLVRLSFARTDQTIADACAALRRVPALLR